MRRKPVILLFLLVFLSVGGAVFYQKLPQHGPPTFTEIDSFLRHSAASGDWGFDAHTPRAYRSVKPGWWSRFGIRRHAHYEQDDYRFIKATILTNEYVVVTVWRENGKVVKIHFTGSSLPADAFKDVTFQKFPPLSHPRYKL